MAKKAIAVYLLLGGIVFLILFSYKMGFLGILSSLIPSLITMLVLTLFIVSGYTFLLNGTSRFSEALLKVSLYIQSFQISLFGYLFKNYFGPYAAFGITFNGEIAFEVKLKPFSFLFANGLNQESHGVSLLINILPIILLIIIHNEKAPNPKDERIKTAKENW